MEKLRFSLNVIAVGSVLFAAFSLSGCSSQGEMDPNEAQKIASQQTKNAQEAPAPAETVDSPKALRRKGGGP